MVSNGSNTLPVLFGNLKACHGRPGDCSVDPGLAHVYKWNPEPSLSRSGSSRSIVDTAGTQWLPEYSSFTQWSQSTGCHPGSSWL